jgi:hypothetical protein
VDSGKIPLFYSFEAKFPQEKRLREYKAGAVFCGKVIKNRQLLLS